MHKTLSLTALSLGMAAYCNPSWAQQTAPLAEAEPEIEVIMVTARKRAETLQDIPLAVTAVDQAAIARNAISTLADIQAQTPSLTIYAARGTSSTATAYIRGVGQSDPLWGVEPGVGIYLNDVYLARPQAALLDMLDVDRIEVLRGPQGTLYGRNTVGSAIKYISRRPTNELSVRADIATGNYQQRNGRLAISGPLLEDTLLGSLALGSFTRDGFGRNLQSGAEVSNKDLVTGRASLLWLLNDNWDLELAADQTRDNSDVRGAQRMLANQFEPYFAGQSALPASTHRYNTDNGYQLPSRTDSRGAAVTLTWDGGANWQFKAISAWRDGDTKGSIDFDMGPYAIADVDADYFDKQLSQELQLNYQSDLWQAVFGVYLLDSEAGGTVRNRFGLPLAALGLAPPQLIPGPICRQFGVSTGQVDTQALAIYADASWQLADAWRLSAGLRASREKKTADVLNQGYTDDSFSQPSGVVSSDFRNSKSWTDLSPRLSLDYKANEDLLLYGSVSRGFKSGGFNVRANTVQVPRSAEAYDPETVVTYELGAKPTFGNSLQLSVALFYSQYRDIQLSIFTGIDTDGDGINDAFFGDFTNAGKGHIQGAEFEFSWAATKALRFSGIAAYLDASYQQYLSGGVNLASERDFTDTPKLAASLNAWYLWPLAAGELTANLGFSWRDKVQPVTNQSDLLQQGAFGIWQASLMFAPADSRWRIALEGKNLADKHYRTTGYDLRDSGFPIVSAYYGDPRLLTLRLSYGF